MALADYEKYSKEKRREFFYKHFPESYPDDDDNRIYEPMADCLHMIASYITELVDLGDLQFTPTHINPDYRSNPRPIIHDWLIEDLEDWIS